MTIYFTYSVTNIFILVSTITRFRLFFLSLLQAFIDPDNLQRISNRSFDLTGLSVLVMLGISRLLLFFITVLLLLSPFQINLCLFIGIKKKINWYQFLVECCLDPDSLAFCRIFKSYDRWISLHLPDSHAFTREPAFTWWHNLHLKSCLYLRILPLPERLPLLDSTIKWFYRQMSLKSVTHAFWTGFIWVAIFLFIHD